MDTVFQLLQILQNPAFERTVRRIHLLEDIVFRPITREQFGAGVLVYQSAKTGKRKSSSGSRYHLVLLDGEPAFARESNHWGKFTTNSMLGSGRHNWVLAGVRTGTDNTRYCGAVLVRDVAEQVRALSEILDKIPDKRAA